MKLTAALIGDNALVIECAKRLLGHGHTVTAIVSPSPQVRAWAGEQGLVTGSEDSVLAGLGFDYLFSAGNLRMLPAATLDLPGKLAINFHDGPLPQRAGVNVTAWAVADEAERHGVTWHVMTARPDAGDVLVAQDFAVDPTETTLSLNVKCLEAGVAAFAELLDGLERDRLTRTRQDLSRRRYHRRDRRPAGALILTWDQPAAALTALVRSTELGPQANPWGLARLPLPQGGMAIVRAALDTQLESFALPGTVVSAQPGSLTIATTSTDLTLSGLSTHDGHPVELPVGALLPDLGRAELEARGRLLAQAWREEPWWVERVADAQPVDVPFRRHDPDGSWLRLPLTELATAAELAAFWARLSGKADFDLGLRLPSTDDLLTEVVPWRVSEPLDETITRGAFFKDIFLRYPHLPHPALTLPVVLDPGADPSPLDGAVIVLGLTPEGSSHWLVDTSQVPEADARALARACDAFLRTGELLTPEEQADLSAQAIATASPFPEATVVRLFTERAALHPDRVAVADGSATLTYGQLEQRSARLALALAAQGAVPGARVGVLLPRGVDLVTALLAVLRTGAAYVPLDPIYPAQRLDAMCADAQPATIVTPEALAACDGPDAAPVDLSTPDSPAYVIYTSGSTGRPKGVQVGHRALTNFLWAMAERPGLTEADTLLAVTTVCFDIAALELFGPLIVGGRVHLASADSTGDGFALAGLLREVGPTVLQATPATWRMLVAAGWTGTDGLRALCGGEALPEHLAVSLLDRCAEVWNLYGPTETTVWSLVSRVLPGEPVTIGAPIANTTCHVVDQALRPVPAGVPGELLIGGAGVADGYLNRPDLTAQRFIAHAGTRVYRTGDVVRRTHSGRLEFLGRADHQVKIRGFRVELGDVEAHLANQLEIGQSLVTVSGDQLIAYAVAAPGWRVDPDAVRATLAESLPEYMVPAQVLVLPAFPLTPNGKVDRKQLPAPALSHVEGARPANAAEQAWCELFAEVLGLESVAADASFFACGGTSVTAVTLISRARDAGRELSAHRLFAHPTPQSLAAQEPPSAQVDLRAELWLDEPATTPDTCGDPETVLLTGASGFVGVHLLRELLGSGVRRVYCLVRDEQRFAATLAHYAVELDHTDVRVLVGDLSSPSLGLAASGYDTLAAEVGTIIHAGAQVHWMRGYAELAGTNVAGMRQILRLAGTGTLKTVHHVSSMSVFAPSPHLVRHGIDAEPGPAEQLVGGYAQTKWVAEQLCELARERGIPVSIYRVARVVGDSINGACQAEDALWQLIRGSVQAGVTPAGSGHVRCDLVPVDFVAEAVVSLVRYGLPGTWHLSNPELISFEEVMRQVQGFGYRCQPVEPRKWSDALAADPENAAHLLAEQFVEANWGAQGGEALLDPGATTEILARLGTACPPIDASLWRTYLGYFRSTGFLPPPR